MGRVSVVHPDLGIGGAERLIVDASRALQESGHEVTMYTGHHDITHCFKETRDGTLKVSVIGSWIPRSILGKFHALLAYLRMIYISFHLLLFARHDLILCDQVSACVPFLKYLDFRNPKSRVIFYCHFPDQLLTTSNSLLKQIYRKPLDYFEELSTRCSDIILVNSKFTSNVVRRTFKSLKSRNLTVLYPCVNIESFNVSKSKVQDETLKKLQLLAKDNFLFLSLNRFERKKNLGLALEALSECILGSDEMNKGNSSAKVHLIMAGGYDSRLADCVDYCNELESQVKDLNLESFVTFVKSPTDYNKIMLLKMSNAVVYTPENEHFGIVPLEAMACSKPVIASASGGPLETIEDGVDGFLCEGSDRYSFAEAMLKLMSDPNSSSKMGSSGYNKVKRKFSYEAFRDNLNNICYPD